MVTLRSTTVDLHIQTSDAPGLVLLALRCSDWILCFPAGSGWFWFICTGNSKRHGIVINQNKTQLWKSGPPLIRRCWLCQRVLIVPGGSVTLTNIGTTRLPSPPTRITFSALNSFRLPSSPRSPLGAILCHGLTSDLHQCADQLVHPKHKTLDFTNFICNTDVYCSLK